MKELFILSLLISGIIFGGCSSQCVKPSFPKISYIETTVITWEDMECKQLDGSLVKRHVLTTQELRDYQDILINAGTTANMCVEIINNYK